MLTHCGYSTSSSFPHLSSNCILVKLAAEPGASPHLSSAAHDAIGIGALVCRQMWEPVCILEQESSPLLGPWGSLEVCCDAAKCSIERCRYLHKMSFLRPTRHIASVCHGDVVE